MRNIGTREVTISASTRVPGTISSSIVFPCTITRYRTIDWKANYETFKQQWSQIGCQCWHLFELITQGYFLRRSILISHARFIHTNPLSKLQLPSGCESPRDTAEHPL